MRCIFCKQDSSLSKSVEHVIPESLGNKTLVLPSGIVCDKCNNYFASKVEKPFLESESVRQLRFHQAIPNKKGRFTNLPGMLLPGGKAVFHRDKTTGAPIVAVSIEEFEKILFNKGGTLVVPGGSRLQQGLVTSRFLAKIALEMMADRLKAHPDGLEYLVDEQQLDLIRNHARRGEIIDWPVSIRTLYNADKKWVDEKGEEAQLVHESDILQTDEGEMYLVLAIFGVEMVINYGGPEIVGYQQWLVKNDEVSPLYTGKNLGFSGLRAVE